MNIYRTKKAGIIKRLEELKLPTDGTLAQLRKRLSNAVCDRLWVCETCHFANRITEMECTNCKKHRLVDKTQTLFEVEGVGIIDWPYCPVDGCTNRECRRLGSPYCHPHTEEKLRAAVTLAWQKYALDQIHAGKLPTADDEVKICVKASLEELHRLQLLKRNQTKIVVDEVAK